MLSKICFRAQFYRRWNGQSALASLHRYIIYDNFDIYFQIDRLKNWALVKLSSIYQG
jgi:hypothetical protein